MKFVNYFIVFAVCLAFCGCEKYPENKLWFKKPEEAFKGGVITYYTIDGIDQIPKIRAWFAEFPYNYTGQKIEDVFALPFTYDKGSSEFKNEYGSGFVKFVSGGRRVEIIFSPKNEEYGAKNVFTQSENWEILKLTKEGQMRVKTVINSKFYELQFN